MFLTSFFVWSFWLQGNKLSLLSSPGQPSFNSYVNQTLTRKNNREQQWATTDYDDDDNNDEDDDDDDDYLTTWLPQLSEPVGAV